MAAPAWETHVALGVSVVSLGLALVTMWVNSRRRKALDLHELHTALLMLEKAAIDHLRAAIEQHPTESDVRQFQNDVKARVRRIKEHEIRRAAEHAVEVCDVVLEEGIREPKPEAFREREDARSQIEEAMQIARDRVLDRIEDLTTRWLRNRSTKT